VYCQKCGITYTPNLDYQSAPRCTMGQLDCWCPIHGNDYPIKLINQAGIWYD